MGHRKKDWPLQAMAWLSKEAAGIFRPMILAGNSSLLQ